MSATEIVEEKVRFPSDALQLSGVLAYPLDAEPTHAVLLCSPHPHFAGDMDNNIIRAVARDAAETAVTLRFDYRGVGDSEIDLPQGLSVFDYWQEVEERQAYDDAIADVAAAGAALSSAGGSLPLAIVGYSFGCATGMRFGLFEPSAEAIVGICPPLTRVSFGFLGNCPKPALFVCSKGDFVFSEDKLLGCQASAGPNLRTELLDVGDHFFRGEEEIVCRPARRFLRHVLLGGDGATPDPPSLQAVP